MEETTTGDSLHMAQPLIYLPFDIIPETILCRLPVKSLLRFRCVCNSWNSLISQDLKFAKKHLRLSPKRQHLVTTTWRIAKELTVTSRPFDSLNLQSTLTTKATQLDYSPVISTYQEGLIGTCDGLICFVIDNRLAVLYNPCIRKVKKLPYMDHLPRVQGLTLFAFGYDPFIDNYKVVAVFSYSMYGNDYYYKNQVKIHSLGTDSWRRIKDFPSRFRFKKQGISHHGVFVSGTVNWLTYLFGVSGCTIVSLHLGEESYQEIPLPDFGNSKILTLNVMRDCLCIFCEESLDSSTAVWLMKEYGNKEAWIKLIRLPCFGDYRPFYTNIVYISEDDNYVLLVFKEGWKLDPTFNSKFKWMLYDLENNTIKSDEIHDNLGLVKSKIYVESLISP